MSLDKEAALIGPDLMEVLSGVTGVAAEDLRAPERVGLLHGVVNALARACEPGEYTLPVARMVQELLVAQARMPATVVDQLSRLGVVSSGRVATRNMQRVLEGIDVDAACASPWLVFWALDNADGLLRHRLASVGTWHLLVTTVGDKPSGRRLVALLDATWRALPTRMCEVAIDMLERDAGAPLPPPPITGSDAHSTFVPAHVEAVETALQLVGPDTADALAPTLAAQAAPVAALGPEPATAAMSAYPANAAAGAAYGPSLSTARDVPRNRPVAPVMAPTPTPSPPVPAYLLLEACRSDIGVHADRLADARAAAIACAHAAVVQSGAPPSQPILVAMRVFLPPAAHSHADRAYRTHLHLDAGFSGSADDVLVHLRELLTKTRAGTEDGPAVVTLVVDGQLYHTVTDLCDKHPVDLRALVPVMGPTHLHWAFEGGAIKRWLALVLVPVLRVLGLTKPSDVANLVRNKDHRYSAHVLTAAADGALRSLVRAYLAAGEGGNDGDSTLFDAATTHSHPVTPAMRQLTERVLAWSDRAGAHDPTVRTLASFATDEGLLLLLQQYAIRNQLAGLYTSTTVRLYPLLFGTAQGAYQTLVATWLLALERLEPAFKPLAILALFESNTGNPYRAQGTDGAQEAGIALVKRATTAAGLDRVVVSGRTPDATARRTMHLQGLEAVRMHLLAQGSAGGAAAQFARDEARTNARLEAAVHAVDTMFTSRAAYSAHHPSALVDVLGRGEHVEVPNGVALAAAYDRRRRDGEAAAAVYLRARVLGEPVKRTRVIVPVVPCRELEPAGRRVKAPRPVKQHVQEYVKPSAQKVHVRDSELTTMRCLVPSGGRTDSSPAVRCGRAQCGSLASPSSCSTPSPWCSTPAAVSKMQRRKRRVCAQC